MFRLHYAQKFPGLVLALQEVCWSNVVTCALHLVIGKLCEVSASLSLDVYRDLLMFSVWRLAD